MGIKDYEIDDSNFKKVDKYFTNFRPSIYEIRKMFKELDEIGFQIKDEFIFSLRDIVYGFYNDSSQIAHSCFLDWSIPTYFTQKKLNICCIFFTKVTLFLKVLLKRCCCYE